MCPTDTPPTLPGVPPGSSQRAALVAYLRHRVREDVKRIGVRPLARLIGVSHPVILGIVSGEHGLTKADTADKIAAHLGLGMEQLLAAAAQFGREHPELVAEEGHTPGERVEREDTRPFLRNLPGWEEAEAVARKKYRYVPEAAWDAVRDLSTAQPPRFLTPEWIGTMASTWAAAMDGDDDE